MRWIKIVPAVTVIIIFSFGVSNAQQCLGLFKLMKPEIPQPVHKEIVRGPDIIGYHKISIQLKPPAKAMPEFDKIDRMQKLVNSSV